MAEELKYHDWWERKDGIDLWSLPHLLFGIFAAIVSPLLSLLPNTAFEITVAVSVGWEVFEKIIGVKETPQNIIFDVFLSAFGFLLASTLVQTYTPTETALATIGSVVFISYLGTIFAGWRAYQRRKRRFV